MTAWIYYWLGVGLLSMTAIIWTALEPTITVNRRVAAAWILGILWAIACFGAAIFTLVGGH